MGDELAVRSGIDVVRFDPRAAVAARNLDDVQRMAVAVAKSGLYGVQSVEEAQIRMVTGMEIGLSMLQSIRGIFVITTGGRKLPGMYADLMVGVCKSHPEVCEYFRLAESTSDKATYATKRRGEPDETKMSFTMADARAAGLANKDPWKCYPAAMLRARASSALARAVYPDLLNGLYSMEELQDMRPEPQIIPTRAEAITDGAWDRDERVAVGSSASAQQLDEQLHTSVEAEQAKLFEDLMVALLDARGPKALDDAMAAIGAAKNGNKLGAEQLEKLRAAAREAKKMMRPMVDDGPPAADRAGTEVVGQ